MTFNFKKFHVNQDRCAMKIGTDGVLLGAWTPLINNQFNVLDIGAGTGLLTLMLAQQCNQATFTGVELDIKAAAQAQVNCAQSPWRNCINIVESDILTFTTSCTYDFIISNPPFYENDLQAKSI